MWYSVECTTEVQNANICLYRLVVCGEKIIEGDEKLGLARVSLAEAMLEWGEQAVFVHVREDVGAYNVFHKFAGDTCEGNWAVVCCIFRLLPLDD